MQKDMARYRVATPLKELHMRKRKIRWVRVIVLLLGLYIAIGTIYSAYDSHVNPERFRESVEFWCK